MVIFGGDGMWVGNKMREWAINIIARVSNPSFAKWRLPKF